MYIIDILDCSLAVVGKQALRVGVVHYTDPHAAFSAFYSGELHN